MLVRTFNQTDQTLLCLQGLEEIIVKNKSDIYALLDRGSAKRRTAETLLNKQSSRSHSVFCITVRSPRAPLPGLPPFNARGAPPQRPSDHAMGAGR